MAAAAGSVLLGCSPSPAADGVDLRLATGPAGAVYRRIGGALAERITARVPGAKVTTVPSGASTDNIRMLLDGEVHMGLTSLDAVFPAGSDESPAGLSALCRLYDSHLHLVVLADSPVTALADLTGARVGLGARDSGTEFTSLRLLSLSGVEADGSYNPQAISAQELIRGDLDAMFSLSGVPTPAITQLAAERPIRLIPLDQEAGALAQEYPGPYVPAAIPSTAYDGVPATGTVAVPNILLVRDDVPADLVEAITGTIFTHPEALATAGGADDAEDATAEPVPEAWQINVRTGISTGPVPLHPGAAAWFRSQKR
nr:TAXI family TRAP transporter solute-binding subunit [Jiangella mangrovi]